MPSAHPKVSMDTIISLAKRRGFVFPSAEIYGGIANTWDFGPLGVALKRNIKQLWWRKFVERREDIIGLDSAIITNPKVWAASGHLEEFSDPLIECKQCHARIRADEYRAKNTHQCPVCHTKDHGDLFTAPKQFNLMFQTFLGPAKESANEAYLRPETAQGIFVNFKNVLQVARKKLPFGIAQIGKAFRNEITPGNFIFRTREFEQMEIEYFVPAEEWERYFSHWEQELWSWIREVGINEKLVEEVEIPEGERAHYSKRTVDFEYAFPFGKKELYGLAYRADFDLQQHTKFSGVSLAYRDPETGATFIPHVIEPSLGVERTFLAVLLSAYRTDGKRTVLSLVPQLAPYKAAVFPLLANKKELVALARKVFRRLTEKFPVAWDDRGNIGKRYYSQDEIGTPFCITIDFESISQKDVTVRERDTAQQVRIPLSRLVAYLTKHLG
ncbi:glycine--tRNA ligase [Candidatus Parcubacteria bacterium]|nr:MAG: glycine--tRNA ligase [Candidatus Parcubacteria bacterium]